VVLCLWKLVDCSFSGVSEGIASSKKGSSALRLFGGRTGAVCLTLSILPAKRN